MINIMPNKILVIGACGMVGVALTLELRQKFGGANVWASDVREENESLKNTGPYVNLDVLNIDSIKILVKKEKINTIYLLAGLMSAGGEKNPKLCWDLNIGGLRQILDLCVDEKIKIFWPSSIAVFGPTTPKKNTPQNTIIEPTTMYGITKYTGELLCHYYHNRYGLDVRSLRYPGLISWQSEPGPGTTEYAVDIFYGAIKEGKYTAPLEAGTYLPMMYMSDAIRATIEIMAASSEKIKNRMSYNLSAISFSPQDIADEIKKHLPTFEITYQPDYRQAIADSWPQSIDDSSAREDWGWQHQYGLAEMTTDMLKNLKDKLK